MKFSTRNRNFFILSMMVLVIIRLKMYTIFFYCLSFLNKFIGSISVWVFFLNHFLTVIGSVLTIFRDKKTFRVSVLIPIPPKPFVHVG